MRNTLSKSAILRGYKVFKNVFDRGVCYSGILINSYVLLGEKTEQSPILWGFSISKKKVPLAVDRNRIRRLMREAVRLNSADLLEALAKKNCTAKIVLLFKQSGEKELRRLQYNDIAASWNEVKKKILEAMQ